MEQNKFLVLAKESSLLDSIVTSSQESLIDHDESTIENEVFENFKPTNGRKVLLRDFFAVLALSFHAIFEGLAIGLESESTKIWILFAGKIDFYRIDPVWDKLYATAPCTNYCYLIFQPLRPTNMSFHFAWAWNCLMRTLLRLCIRHTFWYFH